LLDVFEVGRNLRRDFLFFAGGNVHVRSSDPASRPYPDKPYRNLDTSHET